MLSTTSQMASSDSVELNSSAASVGETTCSSDGKTSEVESEMSCLSSDSSDGMTSEVGKTIGKTIGAHHAKARKTISSNSSDSERLPGASEDEVQWIVLWCRWGWGGAGVRLHDMC